MNKLSLKQRAQILHLLVEGNSLRATARIADVSRNTVDKLLRDVGAACLDYQDKAMRNLPWLTNAFSKKVENHVHAISLHYMYYNFGRIHNSLRVTPAMEAGISDHVWELEEIAALADAI